VVRRDAGEHVGETEVIVARMITVTVAEPDFVGSWVDVAVTIGVPAAEGVNIPADVIAPPIADQVTAVLKLPVPETVAEHWLVCPT